MADRITATRFVPAPPEEIFDLLAHPAQHPVIDGSGTLEEARTGPDRLSLGAKFGMYMNVVGPVHYTMKNTVEEFDEPICIAWRHMGKHRWRYELERVDGGTNVTETCDFSTVPAWRRAAVKYAGRNNEEAIKETLDRLEKHFSTPKP